MEKEEILKTVISLTAENLGKPVDEITEDSKFVEDLGADSLDNVELVLAIESKFEINIPDDVAGEIISVGDAVRRIQEHQNKKS